MSQRPLLFHPLFAVACLIILLLGAALPTLAAEPLTPLRTWRNREGAIVARSQYLVKVEQGNVAVLHGADGSKHPRPLEQLSEADQAYVAEWLKKPTKDPRKESYEPPADSAPAALRDWSITGNPKPYKIPQARLTGISQGRLAIDRPGKGVIRIDFAEFSNEDLEYAFAWRNGTLSMNGELQKSPAEREAEFAELLEAAAPLHLELVHEIKQPSEGETNPVGARCDGVSFSHDGRLLIVSDDTPVNRVYDTNDWKQVATFDSDPKVKSFSISHDGQHVAAPGVEKDVHVWELATGELVQTHETTEPASHVILNPEHAYAVVGLQHGGAFSVPLLGGERQKLSVPSGTLNFRWPTSRSGPTWQSFTWFKHNLFCAGIRTDSDRVICFHLNEQGGLKNTFHYHFHLRKNDPQLIAGGSDELMASAGTTELVLAVSDWDTLHSSSSPISFVEVDDVAVTGRGGPVADTYVYQLAAKEGWLEIRRAKHHALPLYVRLMGERYEGGKLSSDGQHVACMRKDGSVAVFALREFDDPPEWRIAETVHHWAKTGNFAVLNAFAEYVANHDRPCPWNSSETLYDYLCSTVIQDRGLPGPPTKYREKVEGLLRANPGSDFSRIVRAKLRIGEGWEARGAGYAASVSAKGWEEFTKALLDARQLLEPVMEKENPPSSCYVLWLLVARADSIDDEKVQKALDRLLAKHPNLTAAHVERATALMPRWGGAAGDAEAYAAKIADHIGGRDGDLMYARIASALVPYYWDHFFEAEQFDYERIQRGLGHLRKIAPQDPFGYHAALRLATLPPVHRDHAAWFVRKIESAGISPERSLWLNPRHYASIRERLRDEPVAGENQAQMP